jgi:hypothetical protein
MNSSDHPAAYGYQPPRHPGFRHDPPPFLRPPIQEDTLKEHYVQIERKVFAIVLKENSRGRFLRITEGGHGRKTAIIIPSTGLHDFQKLLAEMLAASESIPPLTAPPAAGQPRQA